MKKTDLVQTITVLANIGVLLGVLLLVYELSQNRAMMEAQTRAAVAQGLSDWIYNVADDLETATLIRRGNMGEELTVEERNRYTLLIVAQLRYYENVHYQYRSGLYDEEEFDAQRVAWRRAVFNAQGVRNHFCNTRDAYSPPFVSEIEALLPEACD